MFCRTTPFVFISLHMIQSSDIRSACVPFIALQISYAYVSHLSMRLHDSRLNLSTLELDFKSHHPWPSPIAAAQNLFLFLGLHPDCPRSGPCYVIMLAWVTRCDHSAQLKKKMFRRFDRIEVEPSGHDAFVLRRFHRVSHCVTPSWP